MLTEILSREELIDGIYRFKLAIEARFQPGQFLHIRVDENTTAPLLRRPISVCTYDENAKTCDIIFRVMGDGTQRLSQHKPGEFIDVLGPLGNGFPIEGENIVVIGGGIGIYPLFGILQHHNARNKSAFMGFKSKENIHLIEEFKKYSNVSIATDDGSEGYKGYVAELAERDFDDFDAVYACGPYPMLKATANLAKTKNVKCYVSMEERMACGVGACLGCVCATTNGNARVCKDGPVFDAKNIEW